MSTATSSGQAPETEFKAGSIVRARGREWVVLPGSTPACLKLRPLAGDPEEETALVTSLEKVRPATFPLPDPERVGDFLASRLLRDAFRLSSRASAGPFRSLSRIAVEPRPYQLVPLLMGLKLDPIRLLIADDVGIGKTVEAALIARELLDRGEIERFAVLCPPHLAEQWHGELLDKFHIDAELVLRSTAPRLERHCATGQSLFELYPHVIVSMDFIKTDRRRDEFIRSAPELVIVDEAHTCSFGAEQRGGRHQRHDLVKRLSQDGTRHLILVTATPHSGKEDNFRSLLSFLDPEFAGLPDNLAGTANRKQRERLASHFVQRRRADIEHFMKTDTPFPKREEKEATYKLSREYRELFAKVIAYARETVRDKEGGERHQRVRWWSALALLRSLASSPAAAEATLRERSRTADADTIAEIDSIGERTVLDADTPEAEAESDTSPGSGSTGPEGNGKSESRLLKLAAEAKKLYGDTDAKLTNAVGYINDLLAQGFRPIVFCRFIPTAEYLERELTARLPKGTIVQAITGRLPPADREKRVLELAEHNRRVLVCTDCLSEGINLQEHFDAVMHYDLAWSPTRHEQREGRVDRYGQKRPSVRVLTYYGVDNQVDGVVLEILIRKHRTIRNSLGIAVPIPSESKAVMDAVFEGLLLRERSGGDAQDLLPGFDEIIKLHQTRLFDDWDQSAEREKRSRTLFAQETIKFEEVAREIEEARQAVGTEKDVEAFTLAGLEAHKAVITPKGGRFTIDLGDTPRSLRDRMGQPDKNLAARFSAPIEEEGEILLSRTHPLVEGLATFLIDSSISGGGTDSRASRAGAIRTAAVKTRTTLILIRYRYYIVTKSTEADRSQLAEEIIPLAFESAPNEAKWLALESVETLLRARPDENIKPEQSAAFVRRVVEGYSHLKDRIEAVGRERAAALLDAHQRVRTAAKQKGVRYEVEPQLPADLLAIYVFLPAGQGLE